MSDLRSEIVDILAKMKFFQGQRAGRELWNDKPFEVQEKDLESFNKGIETIRKYILQLEEKAVPVVRGEWEYQWFDSVCSNCGYVNKADIVTRIRDDYNFCPNCGADMRGEKND